MSNSYIPPKDLLENLALYIGNNFGLLKETMEIIFYLPIEEHYKLDKILHNMFKTNEEFIHKDIITLHIEGIKYKFMEDNSLILDNQLKTDENGNSYI